MTLNSDDKIWLIKVIELSVGTVVEYVQGPQHSEHAMKRFRQSYREYQQALREGPPLNQESK